ncbi:FMN-dependent NADH-azoreductase [Hymenobacter crusticola]|uniref:FMN dependent NADH:quinone oxidoreductase n=1 Tax=Hymenobacter crusticola TaxID=1770526 RepID=A0A243W9V6_9BACT|nr:NAD(P)H-dependent oxidoreductase [Hymenobacter crusticola]OUJ72315.1 FMN-dependent NADH-azoreductase [Hymenobacter crusticola]
MHILHIISSPRGSAAFSVQLGNALVDKLVAANPGSTVQVYDLTNKSYPHMEEVYLQAINTPAEEHTSAQQAAVRHSDEAIAALQAADVLVIGAPMYNFGISSTLKAWLDHIVRARVTFRYSEHGPVGLVQGKKVYLAASSGGIYSEGPMVGHDFVVPYLKTVLGTLGMTDVTAVRVEGTAIPGVQDTALEKALASIDLAATSSLVEV